jgi:hypothetical protein
MYEGRESGVGVGQEMRAGLEINSTGCWRFSELKTRLKSIAN